MKKQHQEITVEQITACVSKTGGCIAKGLSKVEACEKADEDARRGWFVEVRDGDEVVYTPEPARTPRMMIVDTCTQVKSHFQATCPDKFAEIVFSIDLATPADLYAFVEACTLDTDDWRYLQDSPEDRKNLYRIVVTLVQSVLDGTILAIPTEDGERIWASPSKSEISKFLEESSHTVRRLTRR